MTVPVVRAERQPDVAATIGPLRAYVHAHARQPADAEDIVQESLARLLQLTDRLTPDSALAYAIVTARNLLADQARDATRAARRGHRLIDLTRPPQPDELVLRVEDRIALGKALAKLPEPQRTTLLRHVLDDEPVTAIAGETGASNGSVAAQLARTRARLRLDYVLALRATELPTGRCRPILVALSAGDTRRQAALHAGRHLMACPTCASISTPLLERRSGLAAVLPWLGLGPAAYLLRKLIRQAPANATALAAVAVVTATGATGAVLVHQRTAGPPAAASAEPVRHVAAANSQLTTAGWLTRDSDHRPVPLDPVALVSMAGERVTATSAPVEAVSADEGFWIGTSDQHRIWVQIRTHGKESRPTITTHDTVSFTGTISSQPAAYASTAGVSRREGAQLLDQQGAHVTIDLTDLRSSSAR